MDSNTLLQRLLASVYYDPTATNPKTGAAGYYLYDDKLPSALGVMVTVDTVCPHFFRAVMGYATFRQLLPFLLNLHAFARPLKN